MDFAATPVLEHRLVRLEPLSAFHSADLAAAAGEGELWRTWYTSIPAPDAVDSEIERRRGLHERGFMAPWAIIDPRTGVAVGMTTYMDIDPDNRRLEIGSTWMARAAQGTGINPAAKLLLLSRAFETLGCVAVEFRTHWHNQQSRSAIERLGAHLDGVLRSHRILADGSLRDTVVYSILAHEWPAVKRGLLARVEKYAGPR